MKVAFVHDWLIHMRGGEKVLESLAELFPDAEIYTLFCDRRNLSPPLLRMKIKTSFLQFLPGIKRYYRWLLPVLPVVIQTLRIPKVDLVISSSHCVAKGIAIPHGAVHVCYCHAPMRYAWGFEQDYFQRMPVWLKPLIAWILSLLRRWDLSTNQRIDAFIANSQNVATRIHSFYARTAEVIYPPVDTSLFQPVPNPERDYYLVVSAFVPYKRIDLVIEAFNALRERKLKIVGSGPLSHFYKSLAKSPNIEFLGSVSGHALRELYANAKALIFPTDEDFGIVPVEAQSCGTPVIAFEKGGALETVSTGTFFTPQTSEALRQAVLSFETKTFDAKKISQCAGQFDKIHFQKKTKQYLEEAVAHYSKHAPSLKGSCQSL